MMTYSTHRFRLKKLLQLYADFLPLCESAEESGKLTKEIALLKSEIEDLGLMVGSGLRREMKTINVIIESGMKHLTEYGCKI